MHAVTDAYSHVQRGEITPVPPRWPVTEFLNVCQLQRPGSCEVSWRNIATMLIDRVMDETPVQELSGRKLG